VSQKGIIGSIWNARIKREQRSSDSRADALKGVRTAHVHHSPEHRAIAHKERTSRLRPLACVPDGGVAGIASAAAAAAGITAQIS